MNKILIIAYFFPPTSAVGGGVIRTLKFVKYLPAFGYRPFVVSVKDSFLLKDESLLGDIPKDILVSRVFHLDPRYLLQLLFKQRAEQRPRGIYLEKRFPLKDFIRRVVFPDFAVGWILPAVWLGLRLMRKEKIDTIFVSVPPFSSLIVGFLLKKLTGKTLVLDYRDLLVLGKKNAKQSGLFVSLKRIIERKIIACSDAIINTSEEYRQSLIDQVGPTTKKFHLITNGFDKQDLEFARFGDRNASFKIYYAGYLYGNRTPFLFFDAIKELVERNTFADHLQVKIIGCVERDVLNYGPLQFLIKNNNLSFEHFLPYREALKKLNQADVFLVTSDIDNNGMLAGKLFEYMALLKPILAVARKDSSTNKLVKKLNLGIAADMFDKRSIEQAIVKLYHDAKIPGRKVKFDADSIEGFERKNLTSRLATVINGIK
ncbi:MAG: glycosyltransferase [Candidatus Omnitrophica bacterium]|nr:glycosyltransferase [Candidatus Omnitrophota bacterium]